MAKKKFNLDQTHGFIGDQPVYKKKVLPYVEPESITNYRLRRDRVLWLLYPDLKEELEERWKTKNT